jgi:2',3'-cyclic-nucleotide 2'-phosphodiesterase (5'-nucleotidase family)
MKHLLFPVAFAMLLLSACCTVVPYQVHSSRFATPGSDGMVAQDSAVLATVEPYREKMEAEMNQILVESVSPLEKGQPESKLGNMVADACFTEAAIKMEQQHSGAIDFCVLNNGGLRSSLPQGKITLKNVYELMPFENELVVITLNGTSTESLLKYISSKGGIPVSNLKLSLSDSALVNVQTGNGLFTKTRNYRILTSDYLSNGGDDMNMFADRVAAEPVGIKVRDAIKQYLQKMGNSNIKLDVKTDGRITR